MSTLIELVNAGSLFRYEPQFEDDRLHERYIYGVPDFRTWIADVLPGLSSDWNIEEAPDQQLFTLFGDFCAGEPLAFPQVINTLRPAGQGIWELKSADIRVFGWFPAKDFFVASAANQATFIKQHSLYNGYIGDAVRKRDALDLDGPKFISGDDPNDVVSNFHFA